MKQRYHTIIRPANGWFVGWVEEIPGTITHGKSLDECRRNLRDSLQLIVETHRDGQFAVISHKATIRLLLCSLLAFDPRRYRDRLDQSPAALNVLDFQDLDHARLTLFNDVSHYMPTPEIPKKRLSRAWDVKS